MFIENVPSKKTKRHRRDMLIIVNHMPPLTGLGFSCFDRGYKHDTPTALGEIVGKSVQQHEVAGRSQGS
jgi:hypothetical protein